MESRFGGESTPGRSYGESRSYSYREPRPVHTGESRQQSFGESRRDVSLDPTGGIAEPQPRQGRLAELRAQLTRLRQEIAYEKEQRERAEEAELERQIAEAQEELNALRNDGPQRRR